MCGREVLNAHGSPRTRGATSFAQWKRERCTAPRSRHYKASAQKRASVDSLDWVDGVATSRPAFRRSVGSATAPQDAGRHRLLPRVLFSSQLNSVELTPDRESQPMADAKRPKPTRTASTDRPSWLVFPITSVVLGRSRTMRFQPVGGSRPPPPPRVLPRRGWRSPEQFGRET